MPGPFRGHILRKIENRKECRVPGRPWSSTELLLSFASPLPPASLLVTPPWRSSLAQGFCVLIGLFWCLENALKKCSCFSELFSFMWSVHAWWYCWPVLLFPDLIKVNPPCYWSSDWGSFAVRWFCGHQPGGENLSVLAISWEHSQEIELIVSCCLCMKNTTIWGCEAMKDLRAFFLDVACQLSHGHGLSYL